MEASASSNKKPLQAEMVYYDATSLRNSQDKQTNEGLGSGIKL